MNQDHTDSCAMLETTNIPQIYVTESTVADNDVLNYEELSYELSHRKSADSGLGLSSADTDENSIIRRKESFTTTISDTSETCERVRTRDKIKTVLGKFRKSSKDNGPLLTEIFLRPSFGIATECAKNLAVFKDLHEKDLRLELKAGALKWEYCGEYSKFVELNHVVSISTCNPISSTMYPMEINWYFDKMETQILAAPNLLMRDIWMQQVFESTSNVFPKYITNMFTAAGWLYVKEGVSGDWEPCWVILKEREVFFCVEDKPMYVADLRKARCILPQTGEGFVKDVKCVWLDLQEKSIYLQSLCEKETNRWGRNIRNAALSNGTALEEMQLTKDNVPVFVDKCINFIARKGLLSVGIYRKKGCNRKVAELWTELNRQAWGTKVTEAQYTEHDVATALKRYFKLLPKPLINNEVASVLCGIACVDYSNPQDKIRRYRFTLQQMPSIHYLTLKRLLGHLHFLQLMSAKNTVPVEELAKIWTTLIILQRPGIQNSLAVQAVTDLIKFYPEIYEISGSELQREMAMLNLLEKFNQDVSVRDSGDLRIWISLGKPGASEMKQILVGPHKSASEVYKELKQNTDFMLNEYVLGGALRRPLQPSENVFEVVVRWGYWHEMDRKDNQLVLAPCNLYAAENDHLAELESSFEFKFADTHSKTFKTCTFKLNKGTLMCYKDAKMTTVLHEWRINEHIWYLGYETKRDPQSSWAITFINKNERFPRRESRFFGNTLAGANHKDMLVWGSALFHAKYLQ